MRRSIVFVAVCVAGIASACIIGPKQDDPSALDPLADAGTIFTDTNPGATSDVAVSDTTPPDPHDDGAVVDGAPGDTSSDAPSDTSSDAPSDTSSDAPTEVSTDASDASDGADGG